MHIQAIIAGSLCIDVSSVFWLLLECSHPVHGETVSGLDPAEDLLDLGKGAVADGTVLKGGQDVLELVRLLGGGPRSRLGGAVLVSQFIQDALKLVDGAQVAQDVRHPAQGAVVDPGQYFVDSVSG